MITIQRYSHEIHFGFAKHLLCSRNLNSSFLYDLPDNGFIAFENDNIVAMGFLRLIEGHYGLMDAYITEPTQLPYLRNECLNLITEQLIARAKDLNLKKVFAFSKDQNIVDRACRYGFENSEFRLIGLNLSKEDSLCRF